MIEIKHLVVSIGLILVGMMVGGETLAQAPKVEVSSEYKLGKNKTLQGHLDSDESGHYLYFNDRKRQHRYTPSIGMTKYDHNFKELWTYDYLPSLRVRTTNVGMKVMKENFLWLYVEEPKKTKRDYILSSIDRNGKLAKKVEVNSLGFRNPSEAPVLSWTVSEDSTMVAVAQTFDRNISTADFEYDVQVLDSDLNILWESSVWMKGMAQSQIEVLSFVLGNDGVFYALVKEYEDKKAKESKKKKTRKGSKKVPAYDLKIYKLGKGMKKPEVLKLNIKDKYAKGASLAIDEAGVITCVGMYGNDRNRNINGVFFQRLNAEGQIDVTNQKEFSARDIEILGKRNTDKEKDGSGSIEGSFVFGTQLTQLDGSIVISAEDNYSLQNRFTGTNNLNRNNFNGSNLNGNSLTTYYSQDIVVIHFESNGEIRHINLIPKTQSSLTREFIYHGSVALDNQPVFFIFNDNKDNIDRPIDKRAKAMTGSTNSVTTLNYIDDKGVLQKEVLIDNREIRSLVLPSTIKRVDENSFIFIALRPRGIAKSSFYIGTVEF